MQAKRRIEPFRVIWLRPHMNKLGNCLTMVHSIDGMHPTARSALLYDSTGTSYRIPDLSVLGTNRIYDLTVGNKSISTPQVKTSQRSQVGEGLRL
jgi:hypothetical protein